MKTFISFADNDVKLMRQLKRMLKDENIEAYVFCQNKEYELGLREKITKAIDGSDILIAIITKKNRSPSVHEEIGYAVGRKKPRIIMLERGAKDGVLSYDHDQARFTNDDFEISCKEIIKHLKKKINNRLIHTEQDSTVFLQKRNIVDKESDDFCVNENSKKLTNVIATSKYQNKFAPNIHPKILFSACPPKLLKDVPANLSEYRSWLNEQIIKVKNLNIDFSSGEKKIGGEKIMYYNASELTFFKYLEIHSNGFVEQGFTESFMYVNKVRGFDPQIHLEISCVVHAFWTFLIFCKEHYSHYNYEGDLDVFLSIKDADQLIPVRFGELDQNNRRELEPWKNDWFGEKPETDEKNIQVIEQIKINDLFGSHIKNLTRRFADKIANMYGVEHA